MFSGIKKAVIAAMKLDNPLPREPLSKRPRQLRSILDKMTYHDEHANVRQIRVINKLKLGLMKLVTSLNTTQLLLPLMTEHPELHTQILEHLNDELRLLLAAVDKLVRIVDQ
jgi:hypothetical protein